MKRAQGNSISLFAKLVTLMLYLILEETSLYVGVCRSGVADLNEESVREKRKHIL